MQERFQHDVGDAVAVAVRIDLARHEEEVAVAEEFVRPVPGNESRELDVLFDSQFPRQPLEAAILRARARQHQPEIHAFLVQLGGGAQRGFKTFLGDETAEGQ